MATLGVNIDHVATIREARRTIEPDPVWAAAAAELGGADAITIHLREDRRHIQDRDLEVLKKTVQVKLNLELAMNPLMVDIACRVAPDQVTIVPENREEVTTEGGLDAVRHKKELAATIGKLQDAGITVSLFIDPEPEQIQTAASLSVPAVELHTGAYANAAKILLRNFNSSPEQPHSSTRRASSSTQAMDLLIVTSPPSQNSRGWKN